MTVTEVYQALKERGHKLIRKTIERDLKESMANESDFGLSSTDGERPERFYIMEGHSTRHQVILSEENIQVLALALNSLKKTAAIGFEQFIDEVEIAVRARIPKVLARALFVSHQQQIIQYGQGGRAKKLTVRELTEVFRALRENRAMSCRYDSRNSPSRKHEVRRFAPIAIELFGGIFYLLTFDLDEPSKTVKRLKLSRVHDIKLLEEKTKASSKTQIETYLHNYGALGGPAHPPIQVQLTGDVTLGEMFEDREFSPNQIVKPLNQGTWEITLTTADSLPLARLLAGYGGNILTIQPTSLRKQVKKLWEEGLRKVS